MTNKTGDSYQFGSFVLDARQGLLLRGAEPIRLPAKAIELLLFFVRNPNQVIDKETLMAEVWKNSFVEDANLAVHISNLRKILNGDVNGKSAIETFPKVGYRFNADVRLVKDDNPSNADEIGETDALKPSSVIKPALSGANSPNQGKSLVPRNRKRIAYLLFIMVVLIGGGYSLRSLFGLHPFTAQTMTRVPGLEQSSSIAFSPNGEYIASSETKDGRYTLTLTHIGSGSSVQLLPPDNVAFWGMTFSRDSNFLYFIKAGSETNSLYKIPILGNRETKILDDVGEKIGFSPNGERFCFVRRTAKDETSIMTANSDGSDERVIATKRSPDFFSPFDVAWSPDGKLIANIVGNSKMGQSMQIVGVDVNTGEEKPLSDSKWVGADGVDWLSDGSGLIAGLMEAGGNSPTQVWFIPYPTGEPRRVTNDLNNYGSVGISADGKTIMAGQFSDGAKVWILPSDGSGPAKPVTPGHLHLFRWIRWTSDGRLVFGSNSGGNRDIWVMNADGTGELQLTENSGSNVMPAGSPDGNVIVFASNRQNEDVFNLWQINANGENPRQLTYGSGENQPVISPDGRWVFYTSGKIDGPLPERTVWKVPIDGGEAEQFVKEPAYGPDISPDGKYLAMWYKRNIETVWRVAIFSADGGDPIRVLDVPMGPPVQWTADGKGVSFVKTVEGVSNIWVQPVDGGTPKQITQFTSDRISHFDWSTDGRLACSRQFRTTDIVLIRNFR